MARLDRLGGAKEVVQVGALIGREFSYALLHAVSPLPEAELQAALARLVDAELVYPRGVAPAATYLFKHMLVQETAYASLLKSRRRELHRTIAAALRERYPETAEAEPEVLGHHYAEAGEIEPAIVHYQRAGERAAARSAHEEAIVHLRKAIALLVTLPESGERNAREVPLQLALGSSLIVVRGYAHADVEAAYERAQVLCEALGDVTRLAAALAGLSVVHNNRAHLERGFELAERLLQIGRQTGDEGAILFGYDQMGSAEYFRGKFTSSLEYFERAIAIYDPSRHHSVALPQPFDAAVFARGFAAWNLWSLGYPDRALAGVKEAVELARALADPFSLAHVLFSETVIRSWRRELGSRPGAAAEAIGLSDAHGFPFYLGLAKAYRGAARATAEAGAMAVREVSDALALVRGTGNEMGSPQTSALRAEVQLAVGDPERGLRAVERGLAASARTGQAYWDAELHRLKGELLLQEGAATVTDVERLFRRALEIARAQEAKSFELRAATSLARLLRTAGKPAEGRALLAPVYEWFTEGFDTGDLVDAKALLGELR